MQPIHSFFVDSEIGSQARFTFEGTPLPGCLQGIFIEGQWQCKQGFLLILSEDSPYDEVLHIHFLDAQLKTRDYLCMKQAFTPGIFRDPRVIDGGRLVFRFFEEPGGWQLQLLEKPVWGLFNRPDPPATRPFSTWFAPSFLRLEHLARIGPDSADNEA